MDVIDSLRGQLDENVINELTQEIGAESNEQTEAASSAIISTLVAGLSKNTQSPEGANSLVSALDRDHDGSVLDDLAGSLFGRRKMQNEKTTDGAGILDHILGGRKTNVSEAVGRATGLDKGQILKLMISLAPMVLGMLGKARNKQGLGATGISDLLRGTVQSQSQRGQGMGLLNRLLDSDGDGEVMDDIVNLGRNAFLSRAK